jgi:pantothenate kinase type III
LDKPVFIAVDVGNSHLSFSARIGAGLRSFSVAWSADRGGFITPESSPVIQFWEYLCRSFLDEWLEENRLNPRVTELPHTEITWWIASVNAPAAEHFRRGLEQHRPADVVRVIDHSLVPVPDNLLNREKTGIDRLLVAWYAAHYLPATRRTSTPFPGVIVVDAGSAVTVDWVDQDGVFRGGMIYPGFRLAAMSLQRGTAALPLIGETNAPSPPLAAGRETRTAIESGLYWSQWGGLCGAIAALQRCAAELGHPSRHQGPPNLVEPHIVVTGGGIPVFRNLLPSHWYWEPQLLPDAILQLAHIVASVEFCESDHGPA